MKFEAISPRACYVDSSILVSVSLFTHCDILTLEIRHLLKAFNSYYCSLRQCNMIHAREIVSDMVISKFWEELEIHDAECP